MRRATPLLDSIDLPYEAIAEFCRRWKVVKLEIFGSALSGEFRTESDLDFLYTFADDAQRGRDFVTMADELSALVGRPVELVSRRALERGKNWIRRKAILENVQTLYEA